jgi:hypothetical protein
MEHLRVVLEREVEMSITASCGHEVFSGNDLIPVEYDDEDINFDGPEPGFEPCIIMASYCRACAERGLKAGYLRKSRG